MVKSKRNGKAGTCHLQDLAKKLDSSNQKPINCRIEFSLEWEALVESSAMFFLFAGCKKKKSVQEFSRQMAIHKIIKKICI